MRALPLFLALLMLLWVPAPAFAADERPVTLPLANGKTLEGVVQSATGTEVVLALAGGERTRRIPWDQLAPLGVYRVRAALAPPANGEARKALAELAADLGLFVEARVEYEKALALGAITEKQFHVLARAAEMHAVEAGVARARKQAEDGDLEGALQTATQLRMHFAGAPNAKAVTKLVDELLELIQRLDQEAAEDQAELAEALADVKRNKEILKRRAEAVKEMGKAQTFADASRSYRERGSVTRARKNADKAQDGFQKARRHFGRLRRILPRDSELRKDVLGKLVALDKAQFELLYGMAVFMWESRIYKHAETWAARASYIDPVHPGLMELRQDLVDSRIRYRVSDMSNARGIVR